MQSFLHTSRRCNMEAQLGCGTDIHAGQIILRSFQIKHVKHSVLAAISM